MLQEKGNSMEKVVTLKLQDKLAKVVVVTDVASYDGLSIHTQGFTKSCTY